MIYSILIIVTIFVAILLKNNWRTLPDAQHNKWLQQRLLWVIVGAVILMVVAGKAHWLMGLLAALLALLNKLTEILRYIPILQKLFGNEQPKNRHRPTQGISVQQAAELLGIKVTANKEEIVRAHKKLMQKVHPDRGGSDALAAQINEAKEIMLSHLS